MPSLAPLAFLAAAAASVRPGAPGLGQAGAGGGGGGTGPWEGWSCPADLSPPLPSGNTHARTHVPPHAVVGTDTTATSQLFPSPQSKQEPHSCAPGSCQLQPLPGHRATCLGTVAAEIPAGCVWSGGASSTPSTPMSPGARILVPGPHAPRYPGQVPFLSAASPSSPRWGDVTGRASQHSCHCFPPASSPQPGKFTPMTAWMASSTRCGAWYPQFSNHHLGAPLWGPPILAVALEPEP